MRRSRRSDGFLSIFQGRVRGRNLHGHICYSGFRLGRRRYPCFAASLGNDPNAIQLSVNRAPQARSAKQTSHAAGWRYRSQERVRSRGVRPQKKLALPLLGLKSRVGATALTPRDTDLYPVFGLGVQHATVGLVYFAGAAGRGGRSFPGVSYPQASLVPGVCDDRTGDTPRVFPLERMPLVTHSRAGGPPLIHPAYPVSEAAMTPRRRHDGRVVPSPEPLRVTNPHAAGIDVHSAIHYVAAPPTAVPADRVPAAALPAHVRTFGACTADLELLADWLSACGITSVAMESTGVYWVPLFELLERRGFQVYLVDPRQTRHAPDGPKATCSIANGFNGCIATAC